MKSSAAFLPALAIATLPSLAAAQVERTVPPADADTITAPITDRYDNSGLARWFYGGGYRTIWATPIPIPVLDLDFAGGLTPVETGGYGQTTTLEFIGADGLEYAVRSIDKDPTRRLDSLFQGTVVARIVQDQVGQFLPTAGLVVDPLLEASDILHPKHRLVVIPDDPRLGEFREEFAGLIGMLTDRPQEGPDDTPGFAGSTRIVGTDTFLDELEEGNCERADLRGYLKARYLDMVIGDRDRHEGQWRWARYPDGPDCDRWRTIPEDRDQAFIMNDGFMMWLFRLVRPQQVRYGPDWPSLKGLTFNAWEIDRQLLVALDEPVWIEVAEEVQRQLTDEIIEEAVRRLPQAHYALRGEFLERSLKARRDGLVEEALEYYRLILREAEIKATDRDEIAIFEHLGDGRLRVTIRYREGPLSDAPYFDRTFTPEVTKEVRLRLQGGDDEVEIRGGTGRIKVRAIGGGGDDRFANRSRAGSGRTRFYDTVGDNVFEGRARVDRSEWERPPSTNLVHRHALDWGGFTRYLPQLGFTPDVGLTAGLTVGFQRYGFRKYPWHSDNAFSAGVGTAGPEFFASWDGRFRHAFGEADLTVHTSYTGLEILRFHGFGNATASDEPAAFYKVDQREFRFAPALEWSWGHGRNRESEQEVDLRGFRPTFRFALGPVLKFSDTPADENADRFFGTLDPAPLGVGGFGQLGGQVSLEFDTRDTPAYPRSGLRFEGGATGFPALWDAEEAFGSVRGTLSTYLTPGAARRAPTLALRIGGEHVFGTFPFHEAAFLGGASDVRGLREERFAGESALFANAEVRLPLAAFDLLFPAEFGILGAADVGRVFFDGDADDADTWHSGFGGGIWFSFLNRNQTLSFTLVDGDDVLGFYARAGLHF